MSAKPVYLTSDVHLGAVPQATTQAFHRWLEHAAERASQVVINGDLFDFWFEYRTGVTPGHADTLARLRTVVDAGVAVVLFGGNHDWWGGRYLEDEVGVTFYRDPQTLTLGGLRTFVAHGDGLGRGDWGYKAMSRVIRSWPAVRAFRMLTPAQGEWFGNLVSRTEDRRISHHGPDPRRVATLQEWARRTLDRHPDVDLVAVGHTHRPDLEEYAPRRWILNSGDWVYGRTYAVLDPSGPRLLTWESTTPVAEP